MRSALTFVKARQFSDQPDVTFEKFQAGRDFFIGLVQSCARYAANKASWVSCSCANHGFVANPGSPASVKIRTPASCP